MPKQVVLVGLGLVLAIGVSGQNRIGPGRMPSTANGEWPYYTADLKGTRYSPLDQINASNFNSVEVSWRFKTDMLGPRPEYKLEGTPVMINRVPPGRLKALRRVILRNAPVELIRLVDHRTEPYRSSETLQCE